MSQSNIDEIRREIQASSIPLLRAVQADNRSDFSGMLWFWLLVRFGDYQCAETYIANDKIRPEVWLTCANRPAQSMRRHLMELENYVNGSFRVASEREWGDAYSLRIVNVSLAAWAQNLLKDIPHPWDENEPPPHGVKREAIWRCFDIETETRTKNGTSQLFLVFTVRVAVGQEQGDDGSHQGLGADIRVPLAVPEVIDASFVQNVYHAARSALISGIRLAQQW